MLTKAGPAVRCQAEPLSAGAAEGARDIETQGLASTVIDRTLIDIWNKIIDINLRPVDSTVLLGYDAVDCT
jgi:hypothetical protein